MKMIKKILNYFKKKEELDYPDDFAIIKFTEVAFENGIKDDSNKIIERYYYDEYGNLKTKTYRYSQERVASLRENFEIPIYDKTDEELEFPIIGKIKLGMIRFISRRQEFY